MNTCLLDRILDDPKALSVRFQPIFQLGSGDNQVDSLEGLIRGPSGTNFERADILFDYVRRKRAEKVMDRTCIMAIFRAAAELPSDVRISLNVHASTLGQNTDFVEFFRDQAGQLSLPLDRFTLEIVEHSPIYNVPGLACSLSALRDLGVRIALDDVGLGNSNYQMILDCHPDFFKLDIFFVEGVSHDADRQAVVKSIICLAEEMKGMVVAEGACSREDVSTLRRMGIKLFQANLLCPPLPLQDLLARGLLSVQTAAGVSRRSKAAVFESARRRLLLAATTPPICQ